MLKFLNLVSDKKFSLIELPVFLTIYMDTRYSSGCCRTMRGFTENTPFELSLSSVFNAINSLIEKGYIKKKYNEEKDCIYYVVPDVEQEANKKIPDCALIETSGDVKPKPQKPLNKPPKVKKGKFTPPTREAVKEGLKKSFEKHFNHEVPEDFIESQTDSFIGHYELVDWEIGRTKKKLKSVGHACSNWVANYSAWGNKDPSDSITVTPPTIDAIVEAIRAIYTPMQFTEKWENDRKTALMEQQARAFYAQMTKKNWQLNTGCNTWQEQLQVFAADQYNTLKVLDPDYIPKTKAERDLRNELYTGFKNSDPMNRNSFETMKLILGIDDLGDYENAK